tara:strand:+ start:19 stop:744 length:726 start_codon:yes stop_codon:yes gene_type:complete
MATHNGALPIVTRGLKCLLDGQDVHSYAGSGTKWTDVSGNGNHATLNNSPTHVGNGFDFDADSDQDAKILQTDDLAPKDNGGEITLAGVVSYGSNPNPTNGGWLCSCAGTDAQFIWHLGRPNGTTKIKMFVGSSSSIVGITGNTNIGTDTKVYFHAAFKSDGTMQLYINETLDASRSSSSGAFSYNDVSSNIILGCQSTGGNPRPGFHTDPTLYSVALYGKFLTDDERIHNYNAYKSRYGL